MLSLSWIDYVPEFVVEVRVVGAETVVGNVMIVVELVDRGWQVNWKETVLYDKSTQRRFAQRQKELQQAAH